MWAAKFSKLQQNIAQLTQLTELFKTTIYCRLMNFCCAWACACARGHGVV